MTSHQELPDGGIIPHGLLDSLYQRFTLGQISISISTADVSNPPTDAELDAAFGEPAEVGAGFVRLIDDNGAGANFFLVASDGSNWWVLTATKAV